MARYIDVEKINLPEGFFNKVDNVPKFYEWVETLPTADVRENVHARFVSKIIKKTDWKGQIQSYYQPNSCSNCNAALTGEENFCPNCGADMREGREDVSNC